jgi:hypothetical protein
MDPDPNVDADLAGGVAYRGAATDRARGAVEGGEDAVAGQLLFVSLEPRQLVAHGVIVAVEQRVPGSIAESGDPLGGADDIREHQSGEHPRVIGGYAGAGKKFFDLVDDDCSYG